MTERAWQQKLRALHGQEDWQCAETSDGGVADWVARDALGRAWHVRETSSSTHGDQHELRRER